MEKNNSDINEEYFSLRKNLQDTFKNLNGFRKIFDHKFKSNVHDRIDIFLEDDFIEKLFFFIETQNDLLIKYENLTNTLIKEKETMENKIKLDQEIHLMLANKLNEKISKKEQELKEARNEIESLNNQINKSKEVHLNNIPNTSDVNEVTEDTSDNKYEENCYHTFSINDDCFKSEDVKLYICSNNDEVISNKKRNNVENIKIKESDIIDTTKMRVSMKPYSHNQINHIYNHNFTQFNFNNKTNIKNFLTNVNPVESEKHYSTVKQSTPTKSKKTGFAYKDILPRYNRIYLDNLKSKVNLHNSEMNLSRDKSDDNWSGKSEKNVDKIKVKNRMSSKKSIEKEIYVSDAQHTIKENITRDSSLSDTKKTSSKDLIKNTIPKHRRLLSSQAELNKSRDHDIDNSKDNSFSSNTPVSNEKITNPTQKLLNKYYEILSNYNKKVKKEENLSFNRSKKNLDNSINEGHGNNCSTGRSVDKKIKYESKNFTSENKKKK